MKSLAFSLLRTVLDDPGATSQSDLPYQVAPDPERPVGATAQSRSRFHVRRHTTRSRSDLSQRPSEVAPEAWSDLSRATGRSRSPSWFPETINRSRSDLSQRPSEVAPEAWSDLSERRAEVAPCFVSARTCDFSRAFWSFHYAPTRRRIIFVLRKTTKNIWKGISLNELISLLLRILCSYLFPVFLYMINLKSNMGLRGIMEINAKIANRLVSNDCFHIIQPKTFDSLLRIVSRLKVDSLIDHLSSLVRYLITQDLIPKPMSSLFPYALISLRTGSTIFYTTTFVLGALKTLNIKEPTCTEHNK
ncbi:hypothetical protein IGI04_006611 [Brassica rapa subsp. trilocularis]|uniref:Reverse transcriptase domain-containing protein n=1 Tax=Brassica rapa subsp. trilocularis TaxID=1813537 RepID=A0ABQ7NHC8_BRACM|nr:hypothetical protein IGI04_006611 [Brassica rapa subsp. trilocularis]